MTKEELEKATGQELIDERNYCGVDGYYGDYLDNVNTEILKRLNRLAELENDYKLIDKSREHLVQEKYNLEYKIENLENKIEHHQEVINTLQKKNAELSEKLNRHKHDCPNCSAFGKHCPHRVNGDPYTYDCYLTVADLEKENAELRKVAEFQQSSNMSRHFENKKLIEESDKYRNMVFDKDKQLTKAKDHIKKLLDCLKQDTNDPQTNYYVCQYMDKAEQFLNSEVEK